MAQLVALHLVAAAPIEAHIGAASLAGQWLAVSTRGLALAPGHTCWPSSKPHLILEEEPEKLRLEALLSLTVLPSEVFWAEAVWAAGGVHTCPPSVARVVFAAVVFHFLGLGAVPPLLVLVKVGGDSTPGPGAWPAFVDAFVVQTTVVLEGEVAELPIDRENHRGLLSSLLEFLGAFPWRSRKRRIQARQQRPQEQQSPHGVPVHGPGSHCLPGSADQ